MEKEQVAPQTIAYQPVTQAPPAYNQPTTYSYNVRTKPDNYLCFAIFVTLCCCLPLGIVGMIYSVNSSSKFDRGDDAGALTDGTAAKNWSIAGLVIGVVLFVILIIVDVTTTTTTTTTTYSYS